MKKIFIDTNFFLIPVQFKVDIFSEIDRLFLTAYELWTVQEVLDELESLAIGSSKDAKAAKLGIQLLKSQKVNIAPPMQEQKAFKGADNHLLKIALDESGTVATQDQALKKRIRAHNLPLVVLRSKKHLMLISE